MSHLKEIIAVDVGNSRMKFGRYFRNGILSTGSLPLPSQVISEDSHTMRHLDLELRENSLADGTEWLISSVNDEKLAVLCQWLLENRPHDAVRILTHRDIRLPLDIDMPDRVGLDRLCNALGATCLAKSGEPVLVVDIGTATTLDIVSGNRRFLGGAIMPGFRAAAAALHNATGQLPDIEVDDLRFPVYPGRNTAAAVKAGLFWGMIGAIRQFLAFAREDSTQALLVLTGGDAFPILEALLNPDFNPHPDSVIGESTRTIGMPGPSNSPACPTPAVQHQTESEPVPDNAFVPVSSFHEAICCPHLTLSGIAMCVQ